MISFRIVILSSALASIVACGSKDGQGSSPGASAVKQQESGGGASGAPSWSITVADSPGLPQCDSGGEGRLAYVKATSTFMACTSGAWSAVTTAVGAAGKSALVKVDAEAAGGNCAAGGKSIKSGIDADVNGNLSDNEVQATSYVCNGADGLNLPSLKEGDS